MAAVGALVMVRGAFTLADLMEPVHSPSTTSGELRTLGIYAMGAGAALIIAAMLVSYVIL
jgi:hypothetical protein